MKLLFVMVLVGLLSLMVGLASNTTARGTGILPYLAFSSSNSCPSCDVDQNGLVDMFDLAQVALHLGDMVVHPAERGGGIFAVGGGVFAGDVRYGVGPAGTDDIEPSAQFPIPTDGQLTVLAVSPTFNTLDDVAQFTVRLNGSDTALELDVPAASTAVGLVIANVDVVAGDLVTLKIDTTAAGSGSVNFRATYVYRSDSQGIAQEVSFATRVGAQTAIFSPLDIGTGSVFCEPDEWLMGGGFDQPGESLRILGSSPASTGSGLANGWMIRARNNVSSDQTLKVFAVCASTGDGGGQDSSGASSAVLLFQTGGIWGIPGLLYIGLGGKQFDEEFAKFPLPRSGTIRSFTVKAVSNNADAPVPITLRKNGVNTDITITIPAGTDGVFDDPDTVFFATQDELSIQYDTTQVTSGYPEEILVTMVYDGHSGDGDSSGDDVEFWRSGAYFYPPSAYFVNGVAGLARGASFHVQSVSQDHLFAFPAAATEKTVRSAKFRILERTGSHSGGGSLTLEIRDHSGSFVRTVSASGVDIQTTPVGAWTSIQLTGTTSDLTISPDEFLAAHWEWSGTPGGDLIVRTIFEVVVTLRSEA